jgi:hypothetical protein
MSYLPRYDPEAVATHSDIDRLRREIAEQRTELKGEMAELRAVTSSQAAALLSLQRTLIPGFIAMFAAMAGIFVAVL